MEGSFNTYFNNILHIGTYLSDADGFSRIIFDVPDAPIGLVIGANRFLKIPLLELLGSCFVKDPKFTLLFVVAPPRA